MDERLRDEFSIQVAVTVYVSEETYGLEISKVLQYPQDCYAHVIWQRNRLVYTGKYYN
jgi:hypothetical protein